MADVMIDHAEDDVRAAVRQLEGGGYTPEAPEPASPPPEPQPQADEETQRIAEKIAARIDGPRAEREIERRGRTRDDRGRFAPKAAQQDERVEEVSAQVDAAIDGMQPQKAPAAMSKQARELLNKLVLDQRLSPEEKNLLAGEFERREQESSKGFEKFRERYKAIEDMIGAVKPKLAKLGFKSETEGIRHLLQHNQNYSQNPVGYVANLIENARQRGVDFTALAQHYGLVQAGAQQQMSPEAIQDQIGQYQAARDIAAFEQNPNYGGLVHPEVRQVMIHALTSGHAHDLASAHDVAIAHLASQGRQLPSEVIGKCCRASRSARF